MDHDSSATGQVVPPMVVFTGKHFNAQLSNGECLVHFMACRLMDGWINSYSLCGPSNIFLCMLFLQAAAEKDVIIFCLPPHTTVDSQPLDTSCFGPLKTYWFETCRQYLFDNPGHVITKFQFSSLFAQAWSKGMTINNIVSGFRSAGIYPFALNIILQNQMIAVFPRGKPVKRLM